MHLIISILLLIFSLNTFSRDLDMRVLNAFNSCLSQNHSQLHVSITKAPQSMTNYFKPSLLQKISFPLSSGVNDGLGFYMQGLLSVDNEDSDMVFVKDNLKYLGRELKKKAIREGLSTLQVSCLSSCLVQHLMSTDEVFPTTSMDLAVSRGKGFCRHFVLATEEILKTASVSYELGISLNHIFLYLNHKGKKVIFDPTNDDGLNSCVFYDEVK